MELQEYFEFLDDDNIRVKGTRVGIESILYEYIYEQYPPEEIVKHFYTLTLEQVYATILYYLRHQEKIKKYVDDWLEWSEEQRNKQLLNPHPSISKLQKIREQKELENNQNVAQISN